jgi:hypothetical protein
LQGLELNDDFFVTYKDEEGDVINVKNEVDLVEAVRWAQEHGVPCLCLQVPFSTADSDSDESWTEIDNGSPRKPSAAEDEDDVDDSEKRSILNHEDAATVVPPIEEEAPQEEPVKEETPVPLPAEEVISESSEEASEQSDLEDGASISQEDVVNHEEAIPEHVIEQEEEETPVSYHNDVVEEEQTAEQDSPAVLTLEPIVQVFQETTYLEEEEAKVPAVGIDRIIEIMCSVNDEYVAEDDDKHFFVALLADPANVEKIVSFLSLPAIKTAISAVAQAERASSGAAQKATTTQLIKVLYQSPEVLGHLNGIPQLEDVLLRVLRGLKPKSLVTSLEVEDDESEVEEATQVDEEETQVEEETQEEEEEPKAYHRSVACDGCGMDESLKGVSVSKGTRNERGEILGVRYKSAVLPDYDLCESCEATGRFQAEAGPFLKIVDPATAPEVIFCALPGTTSGQTENLDWRNPVAREFFEFMRARKEKRSTPTQQPRTAPPTVGAVSASAVVSETQAAPKITCKHLLKTFEAPHGSFSCDICNRTQAVRAVLHGCRECNFDVCHNCYTEKDLGLKLAPPTVAAVAPEPPRVAVVQEQQPAAPQAKFVCDVTLTDGCAVRAGEQLVKTWRVRNSGQERWPQGTRICHVGGDAFGGPVNGVEVPLAAPGEAVGVSVPLTMPQQPGRYTSYWRMVTPHPQSAKFGHRFWVTVNVMAASIAPVTAPVSVPRMPPPPPQIARVPPPPPATSFPMWTPDMLPGSPPVMLPQVPVVHPLRVEERQTEFVATSEFEETVARIADFGFTDVERIVAVLGEVNGNAAAAIERLLEDA